MGVRTIYFGESFNKVNEFSFYFANKKTKENLLFIVFSEQTKHDARIKCEKWIENIFGLEGWYLEKSY